MHLVVCVEQNRPVEIKRCGSDRVLEFFSWKIHGKSKDGRGRINLTLELEVVIVETLGTVGVRRKRLNGDSFMYKRVCEDILKLASL